MRTLKGTVVLAAVAPAIESRADVKVSRRPDAFTARPCAQLARCNLVTWADSAVCRPAIGMHHRSRHT
jgi:hypothetical protein